MIELAEDQEQVVAQEPAPEVTRQPVAVIGQIHTETPIAGADRIHLVEVDCGDAGIWSGVVPKDITFAQRVIVLLQDALLPADNPRWAFMAARHFRVRMARFKGVPSECVILPTEIFESLLPVGHNMESLLGVTKYEKALPKELAGVAKGNFPTFIPKTDEPNFQRVRDLHKQMAGDWYATEKADGTSCTVYRDTDGELHVCSRNLDLERGDGENLYWRMALKYRFDQMPEGFAVQFEIVGPGVQGNPMGLEENEIRVFTVRSLLLNERGSLVTLAAMCHNNQLPMARVVAFGAGPRTPDELRKIAEIKYANGKPGEGIVIRGVEQDSSLSVKVINLAYKD